MNTNLSWPDEHTLIPDLLVSSPGTRQVLDRFGLQGCGGPLGPRETLGFFAKGHEVSLEVLLQEIRVVVQDDKAPAPGEAFAAPELADTIYRPFFQAGIVVTLTLGAAWGAWLLLRMAIDGKLTTAGVLHEVNAHGHAQIFGWIGLFVMGFAYQAFPRFKHTALAHPRLAYLSWWLMLVGLVARSVLEPLVTHAFWLIVPTVAGSVLEVLAIVLFVGIIGRTWQKSGKPLAFYDWYIISAFAWFALQAVYETIYTAATLLTPQREALLPLVALWQPGLRNMQVHGFGMLIVLGVSQRLFHHFFGLPSPRPRRSLVVLACLNLAIVGEVVTLILMQAAFQNKEPLVGRAWAGLWMASVILLTGAVVALLLDWRIFSRVEEPDRSLKFLRTAYVWLLISLAMQVLLPVYQYALLPWLAPDSPGVVNKFSHAFYGAGRHAITVGFLSLMIMGVAAKVVPTLNGVDVRRLSPLWGPFLLLNIGCALRVVGQTLTDFSLEAFPYTAVSGFLEVAGLTLWGVHLWRIMAGRVALKAIDGGCPPDLAAGAPITAEHRVGAVLDCYPRLLDTFLVFGFRPLANPFLRRTLARHVTIGQACRLQSVDLQQLLATLNQHRDGAAPGRLSLPMVT